MIGRIILPVVRLMVELGGHDEQPDQPVGQDEGEADDDCLDAGGHRAHLTVISVLGFSLS